MTTSIEDLYRLYKDCGGKVTTDSRAIAGGEMFFALKGENFDGNEYALQALEKGAAVAVVNAGTPAAAAGDSRVAVVDDTFAALKALANHHRNTSTCDGRRLTIIGLTGTNGKTTTKELIRAVLSARYRVTATEGNLNNDIGVPLSLLKINTDTQLAVIEMGANHPDDIKHLVEVVEPDCGLITNVGKAHLLGFGSFDGVKRAKGQLYDWLDKVGGTAFVNTDSMDLMRMAMERKNMKPEFYGIRDDAAQVLPSDAGHPYLRVLTGGRTIETRLVGAYNAANVLAAIAVGRHFGITLEEAAKAIEAYTPSNNRSQMVKTAKNTLIVDAYNANPSSMGAAIDNFAAVEADYKLALLGDMRELGEDSVSEHVRILEKLEEAGLDAILVGEEFRKAQAENGSAFPWFANSGELADYLADSPVEGAVVLVKGSRGIQMEKAIPSL